MINKIGNTPDLTGSRPELTIENRKDTKSFSDYLLNKLEEVDQLQKDAGNAAKEMFLNDTVDIHNVVISMQKAEVSFRLMMQIRNKVVSAYQEIMRMPV